MEIVWYYFEIFVYFHHHTDDQIEVVNRSLGDMLRCLVGVKQGVCDLILSIAKFAYNISINRSTGKSLFQIVNDYSPRTLIDLVPLPPPMRVSEPTENFAKHIHDLHVEIRRNISLRNEEYKLTTDVHHRSKEFNAGEYVMVRICTERIPKNFMQELWALILSFVNWDLKHIFLISLMTWILAMFPM